TVQTPDGVSPTGGKDFLYIERPVVTAIAPTGGPLAGGTAVKITGTHLEDVGTPAPTAVLFGSKPAKFTVDTALSSGKNVTTITATAPSGTAGSLDVTVTTPGGRSATGAAGKFTYYPSPVLNSVTPTEGTTLGGTAVTLKGTSLLGTNAVYFGTTLATSFTVTNSTTLSATSPPGSGKVAVRVTTPGGTSSSMAAPSFTYKKPDVKTTGTSATVPVACPKTTMGGCTGTTTITTRSSLSQ